MRVYLSALSGLLYLGALALPALHAQQIGLSLPDAPVPSSSLLASSSSPFETASISTEPTLDLNLSASFFSGTDEAQQQATNPAQTSAQRKRSSLLGDAVDEKGNPIPLERQQPKRILGFMPNYRTVAAGAATHPLGWKYNFKIATRQAFDYSSFVFLGLTSISAEGLNEHPVLGKGVHGFYSYTWRGFLDKTDGTYIGAWFLPSLLHEDTRYYPLGSGHNVAVRALYVISRQGVARTYGGHQTPNIAGLGGKVLTQLVSRQYYPTGATSFGVLAEKFGYAAMRDVAFSSIREFYPDIAAHYIRKHNEKAARMSARDVNSIKP